MTLSEVIAEMESIQEELATLVDRQKVLTKELSKLGAAVFRAVRHMAPEGTSRAEFQWGDQQYAIEGSGILQRINEIERVDDHIAIEVTV